MMCRFKKIIFFLSVVFFVNISHANMLPNYGKPEEDHEFSSMEEVEERVRIFKDANMSTMPYWQREAYDNFIKSVEEGKDFSDVNSGWIRLKDDNDKLILGCSPAVWCGYTIDGTLLEDYGYDIIGLGGAFDTDLTIILERLKKKNYKKIIIFGGVNDINLRGFCGVNVIDPNYASEVGLLLNEARNHLQNGVTDIIFVRAKEMTLNVDTLDEMFLNRFNNCAMMYNSMLTYLIGVKYYDIPFDTSSKYSSGYVHYNNIEVYKRIFNDINNM